MAFAAHWLTGKVSWPGWPDWNWLGLLRSGLLVLFAIFYLWVIVFGSLFWVGQSVVAFQRRRRALQSALQRRTPYTTDEIKQKPLVVHARGGVRSLVQILRSTPHLCGGDVLEFLSDVGAAAEGGGHHRHIDENHRFQRPAIPAHVAIPPGAGNTFRQWCETSEEEIANMLLSMDEAAIDEIAQLVRERTGLR